jgi:hypothetical protein
MTNSYVKLFGDIVLSSVWQQPDAVRIVWITMLALADREGVVRGSVLGLAHSARVELEDCEKALEVFASPDEYSRNGDNEGRRIEKHPDGWRILNYGGFRQRLSSEDRREYNRKYMNEYRKKLRESGKPQRTSIRV